MKSEIVEKSYRRKSVRLIDNSRLKKATGNGRQAPKLRRDN